LTQEAEFLIKRYQLQWLVAGAAQRPLSDLQRFVRNTWTEMGIQNADDAVITEQELRAISLALLRDDLPFTPGFYSPIDDVFYLSPGSNLSDPEVQSTVRHETTHLLAGRERTRQAFAQKYGTPKYIRLWEPFEEGMAELINMEASRPKTAPVCSPGLPQTKSSYGSKVDLMCQLIGTAGMGRDFVFEAYFTGNIPDAIFKFLEQRAR